MGTTVNFRKVIAVISSVIMVMSMVLSLSATATAATYYTLTYYAGDVDNLVGSTEVNYQRAANTVFDVAAASRFSRKGYYIKSWNVPSTGETVSPAAQYTMPSKDITFVANWVPQTYSVTFTGKGGKTADGSTNFYVDGTYGTPMTLPENQFVYDGYTFAGWKYDGVVYNEGDTFEIPAVLSTAKIVLAATWTTTPATTTTTTAATTTTTTTTTIATTTSAPETESGSAETIVKTYEINGEINYISNKICYINLDEILNDGQIQSLVINLSSHTDSNIGTVVAAVGATTGGNWYQMDLSNSLDATEYALTFGDTEVCNNLDSGDLQFNYWWGTTNPIYIDSVTATLIPSENPVVPETTVPETTTMPETTTTTTTTMPETTTTTTTTTTTMPETTTTTTTVPETTVTTTTVPETTVTTTTTTTFAPSPYSKVVEVNETISVGQTLDFSTEEIISANKIIESVQVNVTANGEEVKGYSFSIGITAKNNSWQQFGFSGVYNDDEFVFGAAVPEELQAYVKSNTFFSIGYWWGDHESLTVESITVNYRIDSGDYNNDGVVDNSDADALKKYMVGEKVEGYEVEENTGDANGDGVVNVFDYMYLSRNI